VAAAGGPQDIKVFVGVLSRPSNYTTRQAIRETWGNDMRLARVMFFTLAPSSPEALRQVLDEAHTYQDLVVLPEVQDSYHNITHAHVQMYRVAAAMASQVTHVLKTDEDCYVRVPLLLSRLRHMPRHWLLAGKLVKKPSVSRDPAWRWYVSREDFPSDRSITFVWGTATITSIDLAVLIAAGGVHLTMPPGRLLWVADVATGLWVEDIAQQQNVTVNYVDMPTISVSGCRGFDTVTGNIEQPVDVAFRCMHARGGKCCAMKMQPFHGWTPRAV
jgi:hypothetical protein